MAAPGGAARCPDRRDRGTRGADGQRRGGRGRGVGEAYDGAVIAVPAPVAARIVAPDALPAAVADIEYAPHVRLYLARRGVGPARSGIHAFPNETVATVELGAGGDGSWGRVPPGWEWALLCAPAASSGHLLELPDDELAATLWAAGSKIDDRLFPLESAEIVHLVRWRDAVPKVGVLATTVESNGLQRPPIVFAGDWLVQPCVEGAVRSGNAAAAAFRPPRRIDSGACPSSSPRPTSNDSSALMTAELPAYLADLQRLVDIDCGSYTKAGVDEVGRWVTAAFPELGADVEVPPQRGARRHRGGHLRGVAAAGRRC